MRCLSGCCTVVKVLDVALGNFLASSMWAGRYYKLHRSDMVCEMEAVQRPEGIAMCVGLSA